MKRLGLNKGRYHGETLDVEEYLREFHTAALARGWEATQFATISRYQLFGYRRTHASPSRRIYISTGIHGDEPAGPVALRRLIEEDQWPEDTELFLCPCINPTGFANNIRENEAGIDLNRDYRHVQSAEVRAHIAWLDTLPRFDLSLLLHEDWEADGFYVYEVNPDHRPAPGIAILEAVREVCPIQPTAKIDDTWDCVDGLIRPSIPPEQRPLWAETLYLIVHKTRLSLTVEAPSDFPLPLRVDAHVRAVRAALRGQ
jgi:protein MpaA